MQHILQHSIFTLVILLSSTVAVANDDLDLFLAGYLDAFSSSQDMHEYFVDSPHFIFGSHLLVPRSKSEAGDVIEEIRMQLKESGYAKTRIAKTNLRLQLDGRALVTLLLNRYTSDGDLLDVVCSTYGVFNSEQGYQIVSWQPTSVNADEQCE